MVKNPKSVVLKKPEEDPPQWAYGTVCLDTKVIFGRI